MFHTTGDSKQRPDVRIVRLGLQRIAEEDQEIDGAFDDPLSSSGLLAGG